MKFFIDSNELKSAISQVEKGIGDERVFEYLGGVKVIADKDNDELKFIVNNNSLSIIHTTKYVSITEGGEMVVKGNIFTKMVKKLENDSYVTIEVGEDGKQMSINMKGFSAKIALLETKSFPQIATDIIDGGISLNLDGSSLKQALQQTLSCVANDNSKPLLKGVNFACINNNLQLTSCDGFRFVKYDIPDVEVEDFNFTLPSETASVIQYLIGNSVEISATADGKKVMFKSDNTIVYGVPYEGDYPNLDRLISQNHAMDIPIKVSDIISKINLALLVAKDSQSNSLDFTFADDNKINIRATSSVAETNVELELEKNIRLIEDYKIRFDGLLLLGLLRTVADEKIHLGFASHRQQPLTIVGENFKAVIMPIRIVD